MKKIRTVLGDIPAEELGFTYSHEHLFCVPPPQQKDRDFELSDVEKSTEELMNFKKAGGRSLVEGSTIDYGRNIFALVEMSKNTGVNVVATTGFNKYIYYPDWVAKKTAEELADLLCSDIEKGVDGTENRAGVIKGGSYYNFIHPLEQRTTIAAAIANKKTGAPVWIHTEAGTMSREMMTILLENEVLVTDIAIGHMDRNLDWYYHEWILKQGAYLQYDGCSKVKYAPDAIRVEFIKRIKEMGRLKQLLVSGDMGRASYLHAYGGGPGFEFIIKKFIPRLLESGLNEEDIHTIFVENPARWLARF